MKRLILLTALLCASIFSKAQTVDYIVPATDLINMTVQTGDMCFDPNEYKQTAPGTAWGFQWMSTVGVTPTTVTVDWISVSDEGLTIPTTLNGMADANVPMNPSSCGFVGQLFTMNPANYNPGGLNTVMLDYSASVITAQILPPIAGWYVHIEVVYPLPCNDPDLPTLTATSPICPGGSSTISIGGNLNDATDWEVYTTSCGVGSDGSTTGSTYVVSPASTTTYYIRGEGGCVTPGACSQITIIVEDNTAPVPDLVNLPDVNAECISTPTAPTATDNCVGAVTGTPDVTFPITAQGTTIVTWTYDDGNGNTSTQTQNVILNDVSPPIPFVPVLSDIFEECTSTPPTPDANDNCVGVVSATPDVTFPITAQGTTVVTWTYDDGNGNTSTQTQNIIINDVTPPVPDNGSLADINEECSSTPTAPTATDNCAGALTATPDVTFPITTQGTTVVTWTYDDGNGNTTTQTQNVIIDDVTDPVISMCPGNNSFLADSPGCTAQVIWITPIATDNCGAVTMTSTHNSGDFFPIGTTTVTYTATDAAGNTAICSFDITVNSDLNPVVDMMTMVDCFGNSTGAVGISVFGGTAPYMFDWNSGAYTTEDISGVPAGNYDCTVTDANGCSVMVSATVTEPTALVGTIDAVVDPSSCGSADGSIDVTTSGGTSPYSYDWNSGAFTTEDLTNLAAGLYSLTITDNNGCSVMLDTTLSDPGSPTVVVDSTMDASCNGEMDGTAYITVTGGTMPYTFDWDNDGTGDNDDNEDVTGLGAGTYGVVVTDGSGCSASASATINEPSAIDVSVTQNGADLMANTTGVTYQWIDCGTMNPISGETNASYTATSNGDYAVIITDGPCSDTSTCLTVSGIGFDQFQTSMGVYPNPTNGIVNIELNGYNGSTIIYVYDLKGGQALLSKNFENTSGETITLDLSHLESGTYVLSLNYNGTIMTKRLIIQ